MGEDCVANRFTRVRRYDGVEALALVDDGFEVLHLLELLVCGWFRTDVFGNFASETSED
jgi:hypothetical protein